MSTSDSRLRCLIITIGVIFIVLTLFITLAYLLRRPGYISPPSTDCERPILYSTTYDFDYRNKSHEYQNLQSPIDFFRLSLSWSPTFCGRKSEKDRQHFFQCYHRLKFIVHGLWPNTRKTNETNANLRRSHPRNCRNEKMMSLDVIRKYFCLMPSENLMQAEWEKHGTCYWQTPEEYFSQISSLYTKIRLPNDLEEILSNSTISKRSRRQMIKDLFLKINPELQSDQIDVQMVNRGKLLKEVAFCYDQHFNHTTC